MGGLVSTIHLSMQSIATAQRKAKETHKAVYLWDRSLKGLGAYVSPQGSVSWLLQKWSGGTTGKATRVTLGRHPVTSLAEARALACPLIKEVYNGMPLKVVLSQVKAERLAQVTL